jgi:hypothetical protein
MVPLWLFSFQDVSPEGWMAVTVGALVVGLITLLGYFAYQFQANAAARPRRGKAAPGEVEDPFVEGSKTERRTSLRRRGTEVEVKLRDGEAHEELGTAWVVDRSMGGLCLTTEEQFEKGMVLSVRTLNAPETIPWIQVEVRSCRNLSRGGYELGCQFVRPPTWNILLLFG